MISCILITCLRFNLSVGSPVCVVGVDVGMSVDAWGVGVGGTLGEAASPSFALEVGVDVSATSTSCDGGG